MDNSLLPDSYQFYLDPTFPSGIDFSDLPDFTQTLADPFHLDDEPPAKRRTRIRAAKACLACRSRHMKCDSVEPACTRCQLDRKECVYTKSRRGGSHKIRPIEESSRGMGSSTASNATTPGLDTGLSTVDSRQSLSPTMDSSSFPDVWSETSSGNGQEQDLISRFYEYFHPSHPIALPRAHLFSRRKVDPGSFEYLIPVLAYIGSKYDATVNSHQYEQAALDILNSNLPADGFSVQALVLFALAKHCDDEYDVADIYIDKATDLALSLGMDRKGYAIQHGEGDAVLEESWRRMWWWVYIVDASFASSGHRLKHRLQNHSFVVDLPCEDWEYENGNIPTPKTIAEYDSREFYDEEVVFSSMTYLLDVLRIASSCMPWKSKCFVSGSATIAAMDAKFVNWFLYLPSCKHEAVRDDGKIDEVMFLAHVNINIEKIMLHRPHSALIFSEAESRSKCTPPADQRQHRKLQRSIALHTAKSLEATSAIITMFALPTHMLKHSPMVICALAMAVMAQVSACNHVLKLSGHSAGPERVGSSEAYEIGRDRVRLGLGALKGVTVVWARARRNVQEVVGVSRELLVGNMTREVSTGSDSSQDGMSVGS